MLSFSRPARAWGAALLALTLSACGPGGEPAVPAPAGERLEPTFQPGPGAKGGAKGPGARDGQRTKPGRQKPGARPGRGPAASPSATPDGPPGTPEPTGKPAARTPRPDKSPGPRASTVRDPRGDMGGSIGSTPAHADVVGARLARSASGWELTVDFDGDVPARQSGSATMNVVGYLDTDRDGRIDHELLAHLSDDGWSGNHRGPSGARFGSESGISVSTRGSSLVMTFGPGLIDGARRLQWSVASEWGTPEQMSLGTTATDHAPDTGGAAFPG